MREIDSLQGGNLPTPRSPAAGVCRSCGSALEMPGDYCLSCGSSQTKLLGCLLRSEGATLLMLDAEGRELSTDFVKSYLHLYERDSIEYQISLRNFLELVVDRIHRKRPKLVALFAESHELAQIRRLIPFDVKFFGLGNAVGLQSVRCELLKLLKISGLERVETSPSKKLGGAHSTIIGERRGYNIILRLAECHYVKKIVPGRIRAKGAAATGGGVALKITRADERGNLRALLSEGSSVQEIFIVTTAPNKELGELVAEELKKLL